MKVSKPKLILFFLCISCSFLHGQKSQKVFIGARKTHQFSVSTQWVGNRVQHDLNNTSNLLFNIKINNNHQDNVSISICERELNFPDGHDDIVLINCGDSQLNSIGFDDIVEKYRNHQIQMTENPLNIKTIVFTMVNR